LCINTPTSILAEKPATGESASQAHTCLTVRNVNASNTCGPFKCDREQFVFTWAHSEWISGHEFRRLTDEKESRLG